MRIEVEITPDATLRGTSVAKAIGLRGCEIALRSGEDPLPLIDAMFAAYFRALAEAGDLERVVGELGGEVSGDSVKLDVLIRHHTTIRTGEAA